MAWNWLDTQRVVLSKTWLFSYPDASTDKCQICALERRFHRRIGDHKFKEVEENKC